ncbi:MAG: hypothetical protein SFY81_07935 [Verrucomicrobiota bacterium]|nr:hypothetical protein [Verrucomicrobiota bacterium]
MECKITSTKARSLRRQSATTLVEFMIGVSIGGIVLAAIAMLTVYTVRSFGAISNYVDLDKDSRFALDRMSQMIRESDGVISCSTNELVVSYHANNLTYTYNPNTRILTQTYTNGTTTLLEGCDSLTFELFQRNPVNGTYDQYPATLIESAGKMVQVTWICSRTLVGSLVNTESVQSAKIVIRKQ